MASLARVTAVPEVTHRNLLFVSGKGGVGKTIVSQAIAERLASEGRKTLWATIEDPIKPAGELKRINPNLWHFNCDAATAFEEYAALKIGVPGLTKIFLQNKLMRYLAKAAPGIHELVLLGKLWHERLNYDHVVVDMPSTGYGLAMFQSTMNFSRLFGGGPIHRDAEAMLATFADPAGCGQLIVALPEEMPLREALDLGDFLLKLFPTNPPAYLVNRVFPHPDRAELRKLPETPDDWRTPIADSLEDYARKRAILEDYNLRLWRDQGIPYAELGFVPPKPGASLPRSLAEQLAERSYA